MGVLHRLERFVVSLERRVGYVGDLTTRGRRTGRPHSVTVGFVPDRDGTILVAAQRSDGGWARNLGKDPRCEFLVRGNTRHYVARELSGTEREAAIRRIRRRYAGDRRYGLGPAFRLWPD
ncbi:MAG: nitroreductase family deazaflavin-dependent oxidoreductase [Candidatus Limnocylindria bacterium]